MRYSSAKRLVIPTATNWRSHCDLESVKARGSVVVQNDLVTSEQQKMIATRPRLSHEEGDRDHDDHGDM